MRWRCKECSDFNFCFKCYWSAKETHPGHEFEKLLEKAGDPERRPELEDERGSDQQTDTDGGTDAESSDDG